MARPPSTSRRPPRPIPTEEALKELALAYALRFPGTVDAMRRHLTRKMREAAAHGVTPSSKVGPWVEGVIATLVRVRILDDAAWAENRARTLHRRGRGLNLIARDLRMKLSDPATIDEAVDALRRDAPDPDLAAAIRLAKKKRLGPFASTRESDPSARARQRNKQLAALGRAGFSFELARRVVDAPTVEHLEAALSEDLPS